MMLNVVQVGQLHIVPELGLQHVVAVARDRQLDPFKVVCRQGMDILLVIDDVERNAEVIGQSLAARQLADGT